MFDKKVFFKVILIIASIFLVLFTLEKMNFDEIAGPPMLLLLYGPLYLAEAVGLPVLSHSDIFGVINVFGWFVLILFYLVVAYGLAWMWSKMKSKSSENI